MFKSLALLAIIAFASASAGVITTHTHVVEPSFAKVGVVVHSVPSAVSHQSFTRIQNEAQVSDIVAPVVRSVQVAPIVKAVPVQHIVKTVEVVPVVKSVKVHAAPVVSHVQYSTGPLVKTYEASPIIHAAPIVHVSSPYVKTVVSPVAHAIHH